MVLSRVSRFISRLWGKPYRLKVEGKNLFVDWVLPIQKWPDDAHQLYAEDVKKAIQKTVDAKGWEILTTYKTWDAPEYVGYAQKVLAAFVADYNIDGEAGLSRYHGGQLVISFEGRDSARYPLYYAGIQLRQH